MISTIYFSNRQIDKDFVERRIHQLNPHKDNKTVWLKGEDVSMSYTFNPKKYQPKENSFDGFDIVLDGVIYNREVLRKELSEKGYKFHTSFDEELLIRSYIEYGEGVLNKINGSFSFILYDKKNETVFAGKDRLGEKPLCYRYSQSGLEICNRLKPLIQKKDQISQDAVSIYLNCGYVPAPYSIIEGINKLGGGQYVKYNLKTKFFEIKEYWDLPKVDRLDVSYEAAKIEIKKLLRKAVEVRLPKDGNFACFLSGGIDSALITAMASEITGKKINTFTIGFLDPRYDESKVAKQFSKILDTNHQTIICKEDDFRDLIDELLIFYDEPISDSSALVTLLLNKEVGNEFPVAFAGDGGDENFFGANHFKSVIKFNRLERVPGGLRNLGAKLFPKSHKLKGILAFRTEEEFIKRIFIGNNSSTHNQWFDENYRKYLFLGEHSLQKTADLNIKLWLENNSNVKVDRAARAFELDVRSPLLDYKLMEYVRKINPKYKLHNNSSKIIEKDILSEFIPKEIYEQPKKGFSIPVGQWLLAGLREEIANFVNEAFLREINLDLNEMTVESMKNLNLQHQKLIWRLYILSKWTHIHGFQNF